jgi:hypothetical protein
MRIQRSSKHHPIKNIAIGISIYVYAAKGVDKTKSWYLNNRHKTQ